MGGLGDSFWDARTLDLAVTLEKHGLWSAWELHRHFNLGKVCKRPPPKMGGEPPLLPPEKGKNDGPVDTSHAVWKSTSVAVLAPSSGTPSSRYHEERAVNLMSTQAQRQAAPVTQEAAQEGFERRRLDRPGPGDRLCRDGRGQRAQRRTIGSRKCS